MSAFRAEDYRDLPTITQSQCCSLKEATANLRVWVCRVGGGVSVERLHDGRWTRVAGSCTSPTA